MKEFNINMSEIEIRIAYAKCMFDSSKTDAEKAEVTSEYHRIMDEKLKTIGFVV